MKKRYWFEATAPTSIDAWSVRKHQGQGSVAHVLHERMYGYNSYEGKRWLAVVYKKKANRKTWDIYVRTSPGHWHASTFTNKPPIAKVESLEDAKAMVEVLLKLEAA